MNKIAIMIFKMLMFLPFFIFNLGQIISLETFIINIIIFLIKMKITKRLIKSDANQINIYIIMRERKSLK